MSTALLSQASPGLVSACLIPGFPGVKGLGLGVARLSPLPSASPPTPVHTAKRLVGNEAPSELASPQVLCLLRPPSRTAMT